MVAMVSVLLNIRSIHLELHNYTYNTVKPRLMITESASLALKRLFRNNSTNCKMFRLGKFADE